MPNKKVKEFHIVILQFQKEAKELAELRRTLEDLNVIKEMLNYMWLD